jgi:DNA-binding NarL/FixJ family response regulator
VKRLPESQASDGSLLSNREREVLQLIAEGQSTKEIAFALGVSGKTVETHRQQIMRKLNLHNVAGLTRYAIREGITHLD